MLILLSSIHAYSFYRKVYYWQGGVHFIKNISLRI
jgi:hypothetical protein